MMGQEPIPPVAVIAPNPPSVSLLSPGSEAIRKLEQEKKRLLLEKDIADLRGDGIGNPPCPPHNAVDCLMSITRQLMSTPAFFDTPMDIVHLQELITIMVVDSNTNTVHVLLMSTETTIITVDHPHHQHLLPVNNITKTTEAIKKRIGAPVTADRAKNNTIFN